ncbi:MAG: valine--tRNA ligase [Bacteroidetes bacterium]|nr:valine--tRNA ligase [Bacteroidota bacterium]
MTLSKNYIPQEVENKWYQHWVNKGYFSSTPNEKPAYTIVIPPPNVTGILHMGHALNNSVQDVLLRYAKLKGYNTCWVPGTDHASIATEAKVVAMLREKGIDKNALSREEFLGYAWEWKEKYGGIILEQLKKLGCALDWKRTAFTMDEDYYKAVIDVFMDLYKKGYIYRGVKMINWDPKAKTALSDEEVNHKEVNSQLVYINYELEESTADRKFVTIATVRPETILGDTAICVHPDDERYKSLVGKYCLVPLINRRIPIITDDYIDMEFGTGCLKVTPAHDINDYNLGLKHQLEVIDTLNEDGTMSDAAQLYIGEDRFDVRKKIVEELKSKGHIDKIEEYKNQVGFSERTDVVIEPRLSMQWWCKMESLAKPALDVVMNDEIKFYPPKFKNTYRHWMENIKDWCISRQLRWGHRIPAWYDAKGNFVVGRDENEAIENYTIQFTELASSPFVLRQDEDVLDTWFSSWLWPLEVFGWNKNKENNAELDYYYPTATLVTAPEIIFFWVARMIMAGMEYRNQIPFNQVYFTGIVRDKQGRKMSKSLGNSPDLLGMIDNFGADAVRFGVLIASPAGNDLLFDESGCEQGKIFGNKLWNALKLLHILNEKETVNHVDESQTFASRWFEQRLLEVKLEVDQDIKEFKLSEALKKIYSLIWDDYCSWYLEWIKTAQDQPIVAYNIQQANFFFEELMKLLHPFMPFITEEIFHQIKERKEGDDLVIQELRFDGELNRVVLEHGDTLKSIITAIRDVRVKQNLKPKDEIELYLPESYKSALQAIDSILQKQCFAKAVNYTVDAVPNAVSFVVDKLSCYLTSEKEIDQSQQLAQLQKDLDYYQGFLESVNKKLNNEKFVQNAKPEIIEGEVKKKNDALEKIRIIQESLTLLS